MLNPLSTLSKKARLRIAIAIAFCFFVTEISFGFYTRSLALVADAFHVLFDLLSFCVALSAIVISEKGKAAQGLSFGWQRAQLLGSFFNGVFQLALGFSIFLLSVERFIYIEDVDEPKIVLIVACTGLAANIVSGTFLGVHEHGHEHGAGGLDLELLSPHQDLGHRHHVKTAGGKKPWWKKIFSHDHNHGPTPAHDHTNDHDSSLHEEAHSHSHSHGHAHVDTHAHPDAHDHGHHHDLGTKAVLIHLMGDAFNNIGVIISAVIIWKSTSEDRFYADPAVSMIIGIVLVLTALKLVFQGGKILLLSEPLGVNVEDVKHDLERVPGVISVHELHVWRLNEQKSCAMAHVVIADESLDHFNTIAKIMNECLHAYGIHSATLQPELASSTSSGAEDMRLRLRRRETSGCEMNCGSHCEEKSCCG